MKLWLSLALAATLIAGCSRPRSATIGETGAVPIEVDHVYIWVTPDAEREIRALEDAGFTVDREPTHHEGQGTSAVSVEFRNAYLELLYLDPTVSVAAKMTEDVTEYRRRANWRTTGWSPIGIGFHRKDGVSSALPFATRPYQPEWLEPGTSIERLGLETDSLAPRLFVLPDYLAVEDSIALAELVAADTAFAALLEHATGAGRLTHVRVVVADPKGRTEAVRMLEDAHLLEIRVGQQALLELTFDDGIQGRMSDLRPTLPLVLHY